MSDNGLISLFQDNMDDGERYAFPTSKSALKVNILTQYAYFLHVLMWND